MGCACSKSRVGPKTSVASTKPNQSLHNRTLRSRKQSEFEKVPVLMHPTNHPLYMKRMSRLESSIKISE